jgi:hypothetical protein
VDRSGRATHRRSRLSPVRVVDLSLDTGDVAVAQSRE